MQQKFNGLRTTVYMVDDLKAVTTWYKDILGIDPYFDTDFYVGFNVGGYELGLHPQEKPMDKTANVFAYWAVDDVNAMYKLLLSKGAAEQEKPMDVGEGVVLAAVKDPWGNVFGIIDNPYFKIAE